MLEPISIFLLNTGDTFRFKNDKSAPLYKITQCDAGIVGYKRTDTGRETKTTKNRKTVYIRLPYA